MKTFKFIVASVVLALTLLVFVLPILAAVLVFVPCVAPVLLVWSWWDNIYVERQVRLFREKYVGR
jgi:hypothetical protein